MNATLLDTGTTCREASATHLLSQAEHSLDRTRIPAHVAIIMDGNRRWARKRGLPAYLGHTEGGSTLFDIASAAVDFGVRTLTVYAFSTENWQRSKSEVDALLTLFMGYLKDRTPVMIKEGIRLRTIGDLSRFPEDLQTAFAETKATTLAGKKMDLVLALNYGGRDDIRRATVAILEDFARGKIQKEMVTEEMFSTYLDTAEWGDPDLFIRTSGEMRLSNFLLWQLSYAEVYVTSVLWPDFTREELIRAFFEYQQRERRLGG